MVDGIRIGNDELAGLATTPPRRRLAAIAALLPLLAVAACAEGGEHAATDPSATAALAGVQAQVSLDIAARERAAGDGADAVRYYRSVLAMHGGLREKAYVGLADTLLDAGVAGEAIENYRAALAISPHDTDALSGFGAALVALDQPAAAVVALQSSDALSPSPRGMRALAVAFDLLGDYAKAVALCQSGGVQFPGDAGLRDDLGLSQALAGDLDGAVATMQMVAASAGATPADRLNDALVLGLAGRDQDAAQAAAQDLDAASIQSNLLYYAELRALAPAARATALLRPTAAAVASVAAVHPAVPTPQPAPGPQAAFSPQAAAAPVVATDPAARVAAVPLASLVPPATASAGAVAVKTLPSGEAAVLSVVASAAGPDPAAETTTRPIVVTAHRRLGVARPGAPADLAATLPAHEVQFGTLYSEDDAEQEWRRLRTKMPSLLQGRQPRVVTIAVDGTPLFLLRTGGFADRQGAAKFCGDVATAGAACVVK